MINTTIKLTVFGNDHEDLIDQARSEIAKFLNVSPEEVDSKINLDLIVSDSTDSLEPDDYLYSAEVVAKIKSR